jgi:general secretion pathway protein G
MTHPTQTRRRARKARRPGFTLMEVLLVLAILVILGSLTVFFLRGTLSDAHVNATKAQISLLKTPINQFYMKYNRYPSSLDELYQPPDTGDGTIAQPFIEAPVKPDPWGNPMQYQPPASSMENYRLWSNGPDMQEGTGDDIGNWQ